MAAHDQNSASLSLTSRATASLEQLAKADPWFHSDTMAHVLQMFLKEVDTLMEQHLSLQFDDDGYACLTTSLTTVPWEEDAPMCAQRIGDGEDFKLALTNLIAQAARNTSERLPDAGDKAAAVRRGVKFIVDNLHNHIGKPGRNEFIRHVIAQLAPATAGDEEEIAENPWKIPTGAHAEALAINYFDSPVHICAGDADAYDPERPSDATHILAFLLNTLWGRQADIARSATSLRMPLVIHNDILSLIPANLVDASPSVQTVEGWIDRRLKSPAIDHAATARTEPPLDELLTDVVELVRHYRGDECIPQANTEQLRADIEARCIGASNDGYTLHAVYQVLAGSGIYPPVADHESFLDVLATALLQAAPPPAVQIADTHCESPSKPGSTTRVGVLYNPFRDTVNLHLMDDDDDGHAPVRREWLRCPWKLVVTPSDDTRATVSNTCSA